MSVFAPHLQALYDTLGFTVFSGSFNPTLKPDGDIDKGVRPDCKWKSGEIRCLPNRMAYAAITGKEHNVTVIDIDDPEDSDAVALIELMSDCNCVARTPRGGYHYFFAYTPHLNNIAHKDIDVRNDGGCIFVEPSCYIKPTDGEVGKYEFIMTPLDQQEKTLVKTPQAVINFLHKRSIDYHPKDKKPSKNVIVKESKANDNDSVESNPKVLVDDSLLLRLADEIDNNEAYDDWLRNGMICFNEGLGVEVWDKMSKRAPNYDPSACRKKWSTFNTGATKVTQGTWWLWLKNNKYEKYCELIGERDEIKELLEHLNHKDAAKYFYSMNQTKYVYNQFLGWYSIGANNVWSRCSKGVPHNLKRNISDVLGSMAMDYKKSMLKQYAQKQAVCTENALKKQLLDNHKDDLNTVMKAYRLFGSSDFCNGVIAFLSSFYDDPNLEHYMDVNRSVFAFNNKVYDIPNNEVRDIRPDDWVCTTTKYDFPSNVDATARKEMLEFMYGLFEDKAVCDYWLDVMANPILGMNRFEEFHTMTGSGGNGKGAVVELLKAVYGEHYMAFDVTNITKPTEHKAAPNPQLVEARTKRILMTTEPEAEDKLQVGALKPWTGKDAIKVRTLYCEHNYEFKPMFSLFIQTNTIPKLNKIDGGVQRRMCVVQFPFQFVANPTEPNERQGNPDVKDVKCNSAAWRDALVHILLERVAKLRDAPSMPRPAKVREVTEEYIDDNNPLKLWLSRYYTITFNDKDVIPARILKRDYLLDNNIERIDDTKFGSLLKFNKIEKKRTNHGVVYYGLKRKEDAVDEE
jgi:P4 family phage/plasmid primase-like protien